MIARRVIVSGRVQGVGFREGLVAIASAAGVVGWVRNLHDGTVEAWVQGQDSDVERVLGWCATGPAAARVRNLEATPADIDPVLREFRRRPTV